MAVAWPAVRARLAATLPGVVGAAVTVYDGPVVSGDTPSAYLVLAGRPSSSDPSGGSFDQQIGADGFSAYESGTVACELGGITGDTTVPDVFATFDAIAAYVQGDQTLGGTLLPGSTVTVGVDEVVDQQTTSGAVQRLLLAIRYTTRLA